MIVSTTDSVPGREVSSIVGVVAGEAVLGANIFRDFFAGIRDIVGGRSGSYQKVLRDARHHALDDMVEEAMSLGADAIIGVDLGLRGLWVRRIQFSWCRQMEQL